MKPLFPIFLVMGLVGAGAACSSPAPEALLSGSLKAYQLPVVSMHYDGISAGVYGNKTLPIEVDTAGAFSLSLPLQQAAYYKIGSSLLYLSPGDSLRMQMVRNAAKCTFEGKGAAVQNYLKDFAPFRSQDFFPSFTLPAPPMDSVFRAMDSLCRVKIQSLQALEGVGASFKQAEAMRLRAYLATSYLDAYYKYGTYTWNAPEEVKQQQQKDYYQSIAAYVEPILQEVGAHDAYLEVSHVRDLLVRCVQSGVFAFKPSALLTELLGTLDKASAMDDGMDLAEYEANQVYAQSLTHPDLKAAFEAKLRRRSAFLPGKPAPDFMLQDTCFQAHRLSDLKGKPIFLDFWATWCFPCLAQMPKFEELSAQYPQISFVGVSIDVNKEAWLKKLRKDGIPPHIQEFIADPFQAEKDWDLAMIPRFILIDKDFNLVTAFAPRPTDSLRIHSLLQSLQ